MRVGEVVVAPRGDHDRRKIVYGQSTRTLHEGELLLFAVI